ncbi:hypothetical protein C8R42DRAFT_732317 [Lentinula raphanica]|nr:hypothetical protein C8R42DRAFT_732317 [Lentinula raphanica]
MSSFLPVSTTHSTLAPPRINTRSRNRLADSSQPVLAEDDGPVRTPSPVSELPSRAPTPLPPRSPEPFSASATPVLTQPQTPVKNNSVTSPDSSSDSLPGLTPISPISDSDSEYNPEMTSRAASHDGALLRNTSKLPATILAARPTLIHLDALRYMQEIYFTAKGITEADEKKRVTLDEGFTHDLAFAWIRTNRERLLRLDWQDSVNDEGTVVAVSPFWNALFEKWAGRFWDADHASERNRLRMGLGEGEGPFQEFVDMYEAYNKRLVGTEHFFEESQVKTQVQLGLTTEFNRHLAREKIDAKLPYAEWKEKVMDVARFYTPTIVQQKRTMSSDHYDNGRSQSRRAFADSTNASSRPGSWDSSRAPSRNSMGSHLLGPMTEFIKDGLRERGGCYHCRECYSPHNARSCPTKFVHLDYECRPLDKADFKFADDRHRETNKPVSLNEILAAKFEREKKGPKRSAVSSVVFAEDVEMSAVSGPSPSAVASVYGNLPIVHHASGAAVYDRYAQPSTSAVVGVVRERDTALMASLVESDDSNEEEVVRSSNSVCAIPLPVHESPEDEGPVSLPHLLWKATLRASPKEKPYVAEFLLDDGCPFVLIRADVADRLGLVRKRLASPQTLDVAMSNDSRSQVVAFEYCILTPEDVSQKWFSRPYYVRL